MFSLAVSKRFAIFGFAVFVIVNYLLAVQIRGGKMHHTISVVSQCSVVVFLVSTLVADSNTHCAL